MHDDGPVRLCCFKRHWSVQCPDGLVLCCLCLERVTPDQLNIVDGQPENVCRPCADGEAAALARRDGDRDE